MCYDEERDLIAFSVDTGEKGCYIEGHSPVVDVKEGGTFFTVELDTEAEAVRELRLLGFTHAEIAAAREDVDVS
jgi:hypothetical protein